MISHVVTCINARAGLPIEACKIPSSSPVNRVRSASDTELDLSCLLAGLHIAVNLSATSDRCLKISCSWLTTPPLAGSCSLHGSVGDVSFQSRSLFQPQSHILADVLLKKSQLISKLQSTSTASSGHITASSAVDPPHLSRFSNKRSTMAPATPTTVMIPDLFESFLSRTPKVNPHYEVVRDDALKWASE